MDRTNWPRLIAHELDKWKAKAEDYEREWDRCSRQCNEIASERDYLTAQLQEAREERDAAVGRETRLANQLDAWKRTATSNGHELVEARDEARRLREALEAVSEIIKKVGLDVGCISANIAVNDIKAVLDREDQRCSQSTGS